MIQYNILIIEDVKKDYDRIEEKLKQTSVCMEPLRKITLSVNGIQCRKTSHKSLLDFFKAEIIDIVFLDYELTWKDDVHMNGVKVLNEIAEKLPYPVPYIVFTSGRFRSSRIDPLKEIAFAKNGVKFNYHPISKSELFLANQDNEILNDVILKSITFLEKRISLTLIEYPFNANVYNSSQDYSKTALLKDKTANNNPKIPSDLFINQTIRSHEVIALFAKKNELYGLLYVRNSDIRFSILDLGESDLSQADVHAIFIESSIPLSKVTAVSLYINKKYIRRVSKKSHQLLPINGITENMIEEYTKMRNKQIYPGARHTPFHDIFRVLSAL